MSAKTSKTAKTASKNAPSNRQKAKERFYEGKKVIPCMFDGRLTGKGKYTAIQVHGTQEIVINPETQNPVSWSEVE